MKLGRQCINNGTVRHVLSLHLTVVLKAVFKFHNALENLDIVIFK